MSSQDSENGTSGSRGEVEILSTRDLPREQSAKAQLEAYWRELRGSQRLPQRRDVEPGRIAACLPHAFLLERAAPGVGRFRVAGQALAALLATEMRGMPLSIVFTSASRPALRDWLDRCYEDPAIVELPVTRSQGPFRPALTGRLLLLPLLDQDGNVTRALGGLFLDEAPGRSKGQFDIADLPVRCEQLAERPKILFGTGTDAIGGLAEAPRPYLRLVVSNG